MLFTLHLIDTENLAEDVMIDGVGVGQVEAVGLDLAASEAFVGTDDRGASRWRSRARREPPGSRDRIFLTL